jgi:hypothetical protein
LSRVQDNVEVALQPFVNSPILNGVLLKNVLLEPGKRNEVSHKLGRRPLGFIIVRQQKDSRIWDLQASNPGPTETFTIACSHLTTVDVWIF